jgi:hypothetical protein
MYRVWPSRLSPRRRGENEGEGFGTPAARLRYIDPNPPLSPVSERRSIYVQDTQTSLNVPNWQSVNIYQ